MEHSPPKTGEQLVAQFHHSLLALNRISARRLCEESGLSTVEFAESVMMPALDRIGSAWERGDLALSQVYMSGRICEELLDAKMESCDTPPCAHPPMAIAVLKDSHLLGKRMVWSVLRAAGFSLKDYGQINVDELVDRVGEDGIRILLVSTLMLDAALQVRELRERLDARGLEVKLVVGGAPFRFDPQLWREVKADAMSLTASGVIPVIKDLAGRMT